MSIRKEIKEWFQAYLFSTFTILPITLAFVKGWENIDKYFFILYAAYSFISTFLLGFVILFLLLRGALRGRHC